MYEPKRDVRPSCTINPLTVPEARPSRHEFFQLPQLLLKTSESGCRQKVYRGNAPCSDDQTSIPCTSADFCLLIRLVSLLQSFVIRTRTWDYFNKQGQQSAVTHAPQLSKLKQTNILTLGTATQH